MRPSGVVATAVLLVLVAAGPAEARRGRSRPKARPLATVVLPAEGSLAARDPAALKDALELELALFENVLVEDSLGLEADLERAGGDRFEAGALRRALQKRGVDVLIRSAHEGGRASSTLHVAAYAADGRPRVYAALDGSGDADALAARMIAALKPALSSWHRRKPIDLPPPLGAAPKVASGDSLDESSLFLNPDALEGGSGSGRAIVGAPPARDEPRPRRDERADARATRADPIDEGERSAPRRALVGDGDRGDENERPLLADAGAARRPSLADVDAEAAPPRAKATHLFAVAAGFDGATWQYAFEGVQAAQSQRVGANFFGGASLRVDVWPIPWLGADAAISGAAVPFRIKSTEELQINPNEFVAFHVGGHAALRARLLLFDAVGLGARVGYRGWYSSVEVQTVQGEAGGNLTIVPGYELHALGIGPELYVPVVIGDRRLEIEARAEGLPVTLYKETPDNPGATSLAFGWSAALGARFDVIGGVFVEAIGHSTGVHATFDGQGDRRTSLLDEQTGQRQRVQGGTTLNLEAGFTVGVGFFL